MSRVFFAPAKGIEESIPRLIAASGVRERLDPKQRLGIKVHFGEEGNPNYVRPGWVAAAVSALRADVSGCVLLETTTLYRGRRATASDHVRLALKHGFTPQATGCEVEIIDGEHGESYYTVPIHLKHVREARLGKGLKPIRQLLNMAHFKGHMVTGFGGVFKSLAMGLGAKGGKLEMHSQSKPHVTSGKCTACNECIEYCPHQAIEMKNDAAVITGRCTGCASCIMVCPAKAITFKWNEVSDNVQMKVVEYAAATMKDRLMLHFNFAVRVTANCDCMDVDEKPLMPDVGVFASLDPVSCEQAAYDRCRTALDKAWPELKPERQLAYAEQLGLGRREYEVEKV